MVDLDGTLSSVDALHEDFFAGLKNAALPKVVSAIFRSGGKAGMKRELAALAGRDAGISPLRLEFVEHLTVLKKSGKKVHLVTASDQYHADAIGLATNGLFDSVTGSDGSRNLKGPEKAAYLTERFPQGFIYAGDSSADIPVWKASSGAILVGDGKRQMSKLKGEGVPVIDTFEGSEGGIKSWLKLFRLHQWVKNVLILIPLMLGQMFTPEAILMGVLGVLFWSVAGSGSYIVNDIFDVEADRKHRTKCKRPIASGKISISSAFAMSIVLIAGGLAGALFLRLEFGLALLAYLVITLSYSFKLKQVPLLDVGIIALLFTSRIVAGSLLLALPHSPWLTPFAVLLFLSLALAKRHVELVTSDPNDKKYIAGRGYARDDWPLTLALGLGAAMASTVVMLLFITLEAATRGVYANPQMLYVTPLVLLFWFMRIWLLAHRGELDDDPVIFAVKDPVSLGLAGTLLVGFALAVLNVA